MLCLSDDSFSSNDVEQLISFFMHQLMTLSHYFFYFIFYFSLFRVFLNVNWYYVCTWHVPSVRNTWWLIDWSSYEIIDKKVTLMPCKPRLHIIRSTDCSSEGLHQINRCSYIILGLYVHDCAGSLELVSHHQGCWCTDRCTRGERHLLGQTTDLTEQSVSTISDDKEKVYKSCWFLVCYVIKPQQNWSWSLSDPCRVQLSEPYN